MSRARLPLPRAARLLAAAALALSATAPQAAPDGAQNPARARVAAQCAAFWEGAGAPERAAPFRVLARAAGADAAITEARIARLRPAMARLAEDRLTSRRAAALWSRHAALCDPAPAVE